MGKKIVILSCMVIIIFSVIAMPMVWGSDSFFYENFEGFVENSYPSTFTLLYNGTGTANQKVITTVGHDGNNSKVFRLQGASSWASEQQVTLPSPLPSNLIVDLYVKPVSGLWPGRIDLYNPAGSWGTRVSGVLFEGNGTITAIQNGNHNSKLLLQPFTMITWYHVMMEHNLTAKTYNVYIDGVQVGTNIPMHPTLSATRMSLVAGNTGVNEIYFDNVIIRQSSSGNAITNFGFAEQTEPATIDSSAFTVAIEVENGTDISIAISEHEQSHRPQALPKISQVQLPIR